MYSYVMFIISALLTGAAGDTVDGRAVSYTADRVEYVSSSMLITCRLKDYAPRTGVRFSVRVRQLDVADDPDVGAAAQQYLFERLSGARQVRLHNVHDHGYFRLTADVWVDGSDIAAEMIAQGLAQRSEPVEVVVPALQRKDGTAELLRSFEWVMPAPAARPRPASAPLSDRALLNRLRSEADLSRIGTETTLQDALTAIAEAVEPRLPLLILWHDLEQNALVYRDMPVGIEGFGRMRLDMALALILRSVAPSDGLLTVTAEGGALTIATRYAGLNRPRTGVYPAADILAAPSEDRSDMMTGQSGASMR